MLNVSNLTLSFGKRILFKDVNLKFTPGNCYGLIGANGAGKSTFLKILSGEIEPDKGDISLGSGQRIAVLRQDQFAFDEHTVLDTVIMGHKKLYDILHERNAIYAKGDFTEADGIRAADLESLVAEMNGYEAEAEAATLLSGLGIEEALQSRLMKELEGGEKVRVLLAQALFGNPDVLLLDEPTNNLDIRSIRWLEEFLIRFENTLIVVSHDRHFLNTVCTHIADIDYNRIQLYVGNYEFWYQASQLSARQRKDDNRKQQEKVNELKEFIQRFSSNASKAKQATSRKKLLEKITFEDMPASSRRFPYVHFKPTRECGNIIVNASDINVTLEDGTHILKNVNIVVDKGDKIALVGANDLAKSVLFDVLTGYKKPDTGEVEWGTTITWDYFPKDNSPYFQGDMNIVEWLLQYVPGEGETFARSFLGRMLFSGDEALKNVKVLSGGEKVRCMLSKLMLSGANTLLLDDPTNHLDLESITALNNSLTAFPEVLIFASHDQEFVETIANRIVEITPNGLIDRRMTLDEYLDSESVAKVRTEMYGGTVPMKI
ncbi:ABC-F family ATP-binding cassette domain-containing protein [Chrysiogenes arsenatis]|uniref:ABC-F family ATP-binding cassette domain-containing protein n=1 Tax=Chrysiogenes arsenatis TaxID=309797 RepID=UPI0003F6FA45|nr:ATP-binding cassette domain-containing protein [Chrysiogenes arsenatis]